MGIASSKTHPHMRAKGMQASVVGSFNRIYQEAPTTQKQATSRWDVPIIFLVYIAASGQHSDWYWQ